MRYQLRDASPFDRREVELHVRGILLEFLKQGLFGCAQYVMDLMNLVEFVVTREERK